MNSQATTVKAEQTAYVLSYLIGIQLFGKIREEWNAIFGEPNPPSQFYDDFLTAGSIAPVLVRDLLLGRDLPVPTGDSGADESTSAYQLATSIKLRKHP